MKKIIIFSVIVAALLITAIVYSDMSNKEEAAGNPYGKEVLHPATLEQMKDPLYNNQILPNQLKEAVVNKEEAYVYFYSPLCEYCQKTTPILVPLAEDLKIDLKKQNVLEFPESWDEYHIVGTPTLIHFKDGKEAARIAGENSAEEFKLWFQQGAKQ